MVLHNPNNWHWVNKDASPWARQWLDDNLTKIEAKEGDVTAKISKVISMEGDVDVAQRKGKVITIFDVKLTLEYTGSTAEADDISGTITVPEVSHELAEDEFVFDIDIHSESKEKQPVKDLVRSKLVPLLRSEFVKLCPALVAEHGKDIQHAPGSNPSSGFSTPKYHPPTGAVAKPAATSSSQTNRGSVVNTTTVTDNEEFRTTAEELYKTFTDPQRIAAFTRAPPKVFEGAKEGAKFELFGGNVSGEYLELVEPTKIVQSWRLDQWPSGHYSKLQIEFDQNDVDSVTVMRVEWTGVPIGQEEVTKRNWLEYYVRSIKRTFGTVTMAPTYKIAIVQLQPKDVAVEDNFTRATGFIRQAAVQGADLVVLPEYHLTSWCPDHPDFISACAESATYLPRYQALARELNINIVPGTICEVHPATNNDGSKSDKEIRNMAYWISPAGALLSSYQKVNLWHSERPHLTAGLSHTPHVAFDTPLTWGPKHNNRPIRAGMLICWDLAFPEAFRALLNDGAELIVIPSFWVCDGSDLDEARKKMNPDCEGLFINSVMVARAFENECVVVLCNAGGLSQVVAPVYGSVGGQGLGVNEEVMRVVGVDFDAVNVLEREYKVRKDLAGEGWHYGYSSGDGNRNGEGKV
ncbi:putative chaperone binding protein [Chaetomidium leptoderma]|uniref:Chaperone binding protein n=1 Tax=Chaetomidium leptoderma TaxID=669021 RepID=A0AAN6ZXJ9_9PEZI|nr:putative chaperone binding protein [Chaetomidium leptoderma]